MKIQPRWWWDESGLRRWGAWALVAATVGILAVNASYYFPFLSDDALISFRYSERLASGAGLTWTDGPPVEGYSDLLWVLFIAAAHVFRIDSIFAARALDFIGATIAIFFVSFSPVRRSVRWERVVTGGLALALLAPLAVWSLGGLEHGFMSGLIAATLWLLARAVGQGTTDLRDAFLAAVVLAAIALCRVDGALFTGAAVLGVWMTGRRVVTSLRASAVVVALPALAVGGQALFRWFYYGALLPNTAHAKVNFNVDRVVLGFRHVGTGLSAVWPLLIALALSIVVLRRHRPRTWVTLPMCFAALWMLYLGAIGGDIFPGWRQLLLGLVPLAMALANAAEISVDDTEPTPRWIVPGIVGFVLVSLHSQSVDSENERAKIERWEWDGIEIGPLLRSAFGKQKALLAVDAAGALPYWSGLPSLDMLGLNDAYIATHPPPSFGHGGIGHELGDGKYVFEREPDVIAFNNAAGYHDPGFLSGRQMLGLGSSFFSRYQLVVVVAGRVRGELWVRREGGKVGLIRSEDRVEIPGYFLGNFDAPAMLDSAHALSVVVGGRAMGLLPGLRLSPAVWVAEFEPSAGNLDVGITCNGVTMTAAADVPSETLGIGPGDVIDLRIGTLAGASEIRRVTFRKVAEQGAPAKYRCTRGRLTVRAGALMEPKLPGALWNAPSNALFSTSGLRVVLPGPAHAQWIHISRDNNDDYTFSFLSTGREVGRTLLRAAMSGGGLAVARVDVPATATNAGFDEIVVEPTRGDGSYSLGHLIVGPNVRDMAPDDRAIGGRP